MTKLDINALPKPQPGTDPAQHWHDIAVQALRERDAAREPTKPLFASSVARRKWESLQANGHRMQRLHFERAEGESGTIDAWGKVTWDAAAPPPPRSLVEQALSIGANGVPHTELERTLFEAYMTGHCWQVGTWSAEKKEYLDQSSRVLYAVWRARGAIVAEQLEGVRDEMQAGQAIGELARRNLLDSLRWALSHFRCKPFEWTDDRDADAHRKAIALVEHATRQPAAIADSEGGEHD